MRTTSRTKLKTAPNDNALFDTKAKLKDALTSEIVIALCGPIGSPLHEVADVVSKILSENFKYRCEIIRLSNLIKEKAQNTQSTSSGNKAFDKLTYLINQGNILRKDYGSGILAELAVHEIRMKRNREIPTNPERLCHIIDSIKNQEELAVLQKVYGDMLYTVGVFSSLDSREANLKKRGMTSGEIFTLIDRDSGEEVGYGQTVRKTFPLSDFFLMADSGTDSQVKGKVERFLNLILGIGMVTPMAEETAMFNAACASSNSACLSRQVGAALTSKDGELLSVGWNDVPKAGGNVYIFDPRDSIRENDKRCWNVEGGICFNDAEKKVLAASITDTLLKKGIITEDKIEPVTSIIEESKLSELTEFSRAIHAEMHAILNAGRGNGAKIQGGKLFITTYPCHSCARHIIAAGISDVYYIEPYRKSHAVKLHFDSITERDTEDKNMVNIRPYDGVAPSKFMTLFKMSENSRKIDGKMVNKKASEALPRFEKSLEAVPTLENLVISGLVKRNLVGPESDDDS